MTGKEGETTAGGDRALIERGNERKKRYEDQERQKTVEIRERKKRKVLKINHKGSGLFELMEMMCVKNKN